MSTYGGLGKSSWVCGCDGAFNLDVEPGVHCCCMRRVGAVRSGRVAVTSAGKGEVVLRVRMWVHRARTNGR